MTTLVARGQRNWATLGGAAGGLLVFAWLLVRLPLAVTAVAAFGILFLVLALRWPWLAWVAVGAALPFAAIGRVGMISALEVVLLGALALWAADGIRRGQWQATWTAPALAVVIYIAALLASSLRAEDLGQAAAEVVKWSEFALVLVVLPSMVRRSQVRWVVAAMLAAAAAQGLLGVYQFVFRIGPEWFVVLGRFMRASGLFAQPNPYAGYLGLALPVSVSLALAAWPAAASRRAGDRRDELGWALYLTATSALIAAGLLASWSRGGWLGAVAGVAVVVVFRSRRSLVWSGVVALGVLSLALLGSLTPQLVPDPVLGRLQELPNFLGGGDILRQEVDDENFAVIERVAHWVAAQRMFEESPILGVGAGNYAAAYADFRLPAWEEPLGHAHSAYLNTLAETGLVGFGAFALMWVTTVAWVMGRLRRARALAEHHGQALALGTLGVLAALAIHSLVDVLFVQGIYLEIALWIALTGVAVEDRAMRQNFVAEQNVSEWGLNEPTITRNAQP